MTPTTDLGLSIRLSIFELRETGDWDIFSGPPERARAETGGADQWVLKRRECSGFARVNKVSSASMGYPLSVFNQNSTLKGTGRHADASEGANALRLIKQDTSIRNWMDKSTSHGSRDLSVSTKSTLWSNDTFQRRCGILWPRKMVRLIIHYHVFQNSNFSNLPRELLKSGHGLQRPNWELLEKSC